ncbi:MAG: efflux RND transporter periplasmic adaptor subunit [Micavibrio sp.]|nr:MAG: efflux RND transporter periplasmic adaptor subunit [Micavibrio sp.]
MKKIAALLGVILFFLTAPVQAEDAHYTCPMHPHYISTHAGTCPICGMDLVRTENGDTDDRDEASQIRRGAVTISPEVIQNTGVRSVRAEYARFGGIVRSYGNVTENIRLLSEISARVSGWVETPEITAVGDPVQKGDLLFTLYSPELVSAQQDYLSALSTGISGRINSAARRLAALGMQPRVIDELRRKRSAFDYVPFYAEHGGTVSEIGIRRGSHVTPGMSLAKIQDYSSVWITAHVAEKDLHHLYPRGQARVVFPHLGGMEREAQIDYIYPTVDARTRTGRVRLVLENEDGRLRPGAYADVIFETRIAARLSVPSEAVLRSSEGEFVIRAEAGGRFRPERVETGLRSRGRTEILSGIEDGDEIVVSGQFMLDSESSMREAFRKMQRMQTPLAFLEISSNQQAIIDHLTDAAIYLQKSLTGQEEFDPAMLKPAMDIRDILLPEFAGTRLEFVLKDAHWALVLAYNSMTDSELQNALKQLTDALAPWLLDGRPGYYREKGLFLFHDHGSGALWIQVESEPANPYGDNADAMRQDWPEHPDTAAPDMKEDDDTGGLHDGHVH